MIIELKGYSLGVRKVGKVQNTLNYKTARKEPQP